MPTYTVEIEASNETGDIWQALEPAETIEDDTTPADLAEFVAGNQNVAEGDTGWRVRVWSGADADTSTKPTAEWVAGEDDVLRSLSATRAAIADLIEQRDGFVRQLMTTTGVARARVAEAAGVKEARLYQIRDGR